MLLLQKRIAQQPGVRPQPRPGHQAWRLGLQPARPPQRIKEIIRRKKKGLRRKNVKEDKKGLRRTLEELRVKMKCQKVKGEKKVKGETNA